MIHQGTLTTGDDSGRGHAAPDLALRSPGSNVRREMRKLPGTARQVEYPHRGGGKTAQSSKPAPWRWKRPRSMT